ncbi:MAG: polysaccharide pyruvyl transferase family protein [Caulobacter sp.]|nr:polysaccharide pyruvyl transferase family protein [Caulobacter sp.]
MAPGKIGVLTFHRCINYGSYWQARCLVEGLRAAGHDAILLDHVSERVNRAEWRCALSPHLPAPTAAPDRRLFRAKIDRFLEAFDGLPLSAPFDIDQPESMDPCDLVIVGSDEVWNLRHPWYGSHRLFFGDRLRADRLASYAASFGNHDVHDGLDPALARDLQGFSHISVRDANSRALVEQSLGRVPALVLDPCLQFPPKAQPDEGLADAIVVYGHTFPDWLQRQVTDLARASGRRLVSLRYRNDWADEQRLDLGPAAFARGMAGAGAVVTTFFHGCVFALLNGKPFLCAASAYRSNKITALTTSLGARRHLVTEATPAAHYRALLDRPLSAEIPQRIARLRDRSRRYLDAVLA